MYQPLIPCPGCARHVRAVESACPFCTAILPASFAELAAPDTRARLTRKATVLFGVAALAVSGCSAAVGPDGGEMQRDVATADAVPLVDTLRAPDARDAFAGTDVRDAVALVDTGPDDNGGSVDLYGAPPPRDAGPDDQGNIGLLYGAPIDPPDGN